jgi:tetratricopeptide (TPR) repeat protein
MRKLLKAVGVRLRAFVDQRDDVAMILGAPEDDATPLLAMLEGLEAERPSDFFWTFTDAFVDAASYAQVVVSAFAVKHEGVRLAMEREGMKPWPPLPPTVTSAATPPAQRLRELAAFSRQLLPIPNGGLVVWTFFPAGIADAAAYARLMGAIIAHEFPFPWCHHLRFIIRDDPAGRVVEASLAGVPRVQRYAPDLSVDAINRSMDEEVADETLPLHERMAVLPASAASDLAYARFPLALEKYALLLQYHGSMNNYPMAALALHGMGQVWERTGDLAKASEAYQAALAPASHGEHPPIPIFLNVVLSLANLRTSEERWDEAEGYWDATQQLATVARDGPLKVRALEHRGYCQERQGKLQEAEESWRAGSIIATQLGDVGLCAASLERLHSLYARRGQAAREREVREQLAGLGRPVAD